MFQKAYVIGGILLLALVTAFVTPAFAQRGGHAGGGRGGGAHFGGAHFGGHSGAHFGGAHFGGQHGGVFRGGVHHFGHSPSHFRSYYPYSYGYYPGYSTYPYSTYSSGYSGYYGYVPQDYADDSDYTPSAGNYQSLYPSASVTPQADTTAHLTVTVPADAQVWLQGVQTSSTGSVRQFNSPPLTPGKRYTYEAKASWTENGHEVTQTRKVPVTAGAHVDVDFLVPPTTGETTSSTNDR